MKICVVSDFDFRSSGYFNIAVSLLKGLSERGHDVKAIGMGYNGEEHTFPFSIIPARSIEESLAIGQNLSILWRFDIFLVIMDIPVQDGYLRAVGNSPGLNYVGIMPIEADPLCTSWALTLMQMKRALIISEFGSREAHRVGVNSEYLPVGINTESWRPPTQEERQNLRKALGFADDEFVFLTVAFNQERKFLSRGIEMFADYVYDTYEVEEQLAISKSLVPVRKAKYVLVTAEHSPFGWKLRDLAQEFGISDKLVIFERGMPHDKLWGIYAASDAFLLPSKAEGLGMPLLEAMSVGLPCVGTNCTGIKELLSDGRGFLIPPEYSIRDPFGNGRRYYPDRKRGTEILQKLATGQHSKMINKAKKYVENRTWDKSVDILENVLLDVMEESNEQKKNQETNSEQLS